MLKIGKNLLIIISISIALVLLTFYMIGLYTGDNEGNVKVPNVIDVRIDKAKKSLEENGLRYEIVDSVYSDEHKRMAVTEQDPSAGSEVKPDRKIYLIINSMSKPMVKMPKLVNTSFNLAKVLLKNSGLKLGTITEIHSELGNGFVIQQFHKNDSIGSNQMIEKGSTIDLWVSKKASELEEEIGEEGEIPTTNPTPGIDGNN